MPTSPQNSGPCDGAAALFNALVENLAARGKAETLDDAVRQLKDYAPDLTRAELAEHIREHGGSVNRTRKEDAEKSFSKIKTEAYAATAPTLEQRAVNNLINSIERKMANQIDPTKELNALKLKRKSLALEVEKMKADWESGNLEGYAPKLKTQAQDKVIEDLQFEKAEINASIRRTLAEAQPQTAWARTKEAAGLASVFQLGGDLILGRQGLLTALAHPLRTGKRVASIAPNLLKSPEAFKREMFRRQERVRKHPKYMEAKRAGLPLTEGGHGAALTSREEFALSQFTEKIPVFARLEEFNRTMLNEMRMDSYDALTDAFADDGISIKDKRKGIANFVADMTGRSNLGSAEKAAAEFGRFVLSPRYYTSRLKMLAGPVRLLSGSLGGPGGYQKGTRKIIAMEYARILAGMTTAVALQAVAMRIFNEDEDKKKMVFDPRSKDFLKLKMGRQTRDTLGGLQQFAVLGTQLFSGQRVDRKGRKKFLRGRWTNGKSKVDFDSPGAKMNINAPDAYDVGTRFVRQRMSVPLGAAMELLTQTDANGRPIDVQSFIENRMPIIARNIAESFSEMGPGGEAVASSVADFVGLGGYIESDDEDWDKPKHVFPDAKRLFGKLRDGDRIGLAR